VVIIKLQANQWFQRIFAVASVAASTVMEDSAIDNGLIAPSAENVWEGFLLLNWRVISPKQN
jgi:hypothetical protein